MSNRKCPGCGAVARKFVLVTLAGQDGACRGARVCLKCESRAVKIVPVLLAPVVDLGRAEARATADVLAPFLRNVKAKIRALKSVDPAFPDAGHDAKLETLEGIEHMLSTGRA